MRRRLTAVAAGVAVTGLGTIVGLAAPGGAAPTQPTVNPLVLHVSGGASPTDLPGPTSADGVGPGEMIVITQGSSVLGCTANFVWTDSSGNRYLGTAGHCLLPSNVAEAGASQLAKLDTDIQICTKSCLFGGQTGFLLDPVVGNMLDLGAAGYYARQYPNGQPNVLGDDFALIALPAGTTVRPAVPVWGGPTGPGTIGTGSPVCFYGNAAGLGEVFATKARTGIGMGEQADPAPNQAISPWYANVPAFEGDSGSAVVNCTPGAGGLTGTTAVGILTDLVAGGTGVVEGTTVAQAVQMVAADLHLSISLVNG